MKSRMHSDRIAIVLAIPRGRSMRTGTSPARSAPFVAGERVLQLRRIHTNTHARRIAGTDRMTILQQENSSLAPPLSSRDCITPVLHVYIRGIVYMSAAEYG